MRDLRVVIRRLNCDLPVTEEEMEMAADYMKKMAASANRTKSIIFTLLGVAIVCVLISSLIR